MTNAVSVALHEGFGFHQTAHVEQVGYGSTWRTGSWCCEAQRHGGMTHTHGPTAPMFSVCCLDLAFPVS
ncbi:MAG TPA: hypothetical protein VFK31_05975 [Rhodanobacteraceae bacterium]|nr:hypothetical protein [Rhodanobacteraceae bacterium]